MKLQPTAKVEFVTSKGKIAFDLYPDCIPNLCKAFLSNCVNKRFNGCTFDRITSDLVQSQQSQTLNSLPKEFHSRLKFDGKGDVGLLNLEEHNKATADGFFITRKPCPTFNSQYVIIGKISDDTIYNVMKIGDCEKKPDGESPLYPISIIDTIVPLPYFEDLEELTQNSEEPKAPAAKKQKKLVKISYDDDENDEDAPFVMKSAHGNRPLKQVVLKQEQITSTKVVSKLEEADEKQKDTIAKSETGVNKTNNYLQLSEVRENQSKEKESREEELRVEHGGQPKDELPSIDNAKPAPSIDPYDPNLDIEIDTISYEKLQNHYFKCR